jgi:hypothetical protein
MGRKAYLAYGITRCECDIRNGSVAGMKRIDCKVDHAFEPLIRTNMANGLPSRKGLQCVMSSVTTGTSALLCVILQQERVDDFLRNVNIPTLSQIKKR